MSLLKSYNGLTNRHIAEEFNTSESRIKNMRHGSVKVDESLFQRIRDKYDADLPIKLYNTIDNNESGNVAEESPIQYNASIKKGTPYFDLPVSAGQIGQIDSGSLADKYINIPGVTCIAFFPVIGFSMEPTVRNGDIIGIDSIDSWERLDPDKIYYIITHEDRMIKRLMYDPANPEVITCYSDNYPPFTIDKSHIKAIYRVVFRGSVL